MTRQIGLVITKRTTAWFFKHADFLSLTDKTAFSMAQSAFRNKLMFAKCLKIGEALDLWRSQTIGEKIGQLFVLQSDVMG